MIPGRLAHAPTVAQNQYRKEAGASALRRSTLSWRSSHQAASSSVCEECRASCYRRMHEAKLLRWGRSGTKRTDHTDETEDSGKDKKHRSSTERQGDVSSDMPMDQLGGDLMVSGDYCQNEMLLDPGDQALETFVEGPTVQ